MKQSGIYSIRNTSNGKIYIGQSVNLKKRKASHFSYLRNRKHRNEYLQRAYLANPDVFVFDVVELCAPELLNTKEREWIDKFDSMNEKFGYNLETGGKADFKKSAETIEKMRVAASGKTIPPEVRAKMSVSAKGRIVSAETRAKNAEAAKRLYHSPESRLKRSIKMTGRTQSPESRAKMSKWWADRAVKKLCMETGCQ
jgi:group I intron endonuclease